MPIIDFPSSPTVNQVFTSGDRSWQWTGSVWMSVAKSAEPGRFVVSATAPTNPVDGDAWFDSVTAQMFLYYDSYWVEVGTNMSGAAGPAGADGQAGIQGPQGPAGIVGNYIQPIFLMGA